MSYIKVYEVDKNGKPDFSKEKILVVSESFRRKLIDFINESQQIKHIDFSRKREY